MRVGVALIAGLLLLTGCNNAMFDSGIKADIRKDLKDPDSAQFRNTAEIGAWGCAEVNSKNSFGAYTGFHPMVVKKVGKEWMDWDTKIPFCDKAQLEELIKYDQRYDSYEAEFFKTLHEKKLVPDNVRKGDDIPAGACKDHFTSFFQARLFSTGLPTQQDRSKWASKLEDIMSDLKKDGCTSKAYD